MVAFLLLLWNVRLVRWIQRRLFQRRSLPAAQMRVLKISFIAVSVLVLIGVYAGIFLGAGYILSKVDPVRMAGLFDFATIREESFFHWANKNVFAERIVFWQAGWEIFNDYPLLGVGPGNAGYFFAQKLSAFSLSLTEVRTLLYQQTTLPNIKSLWVRLLAETGVVGLALFLSWGYVLWLSAQFLRKRREPLLQMVGLAGSFVIIGFIIEGFSIDTFALPYYWFSFGLLTTAYEVVRQGSTSLPEAGKEMGRVLLQGDGYGQ
jgi:O-antigen ligase